MINLPNGICARAYCRKSRVSCCAYNWILSPDFDFCEKSQTIALAPSHYSTINGCLQLSRNLKLKIKWKGILKAITIIECWSHFQHKNLIHASISTVIRRESTTMKCKKDRKKRNQAWGDIIISKFACMKERKEIFQKKPRFLRHVSRCIMTICRPRWMQHI